MKNQGVTSELPIAVDGLSDAARWIVGHRNECGNALIPIVRERFNLTALQAIEALKHAHTLEYARAG